MDVKRVAHIRWDYRPVIRRIVRWADNVARSVDDRRKTLTKAEFVGGGGRSVRRLRRGSFKWETGFAIGPGTDARFFVSPMSATVS
jgi:hypothetical protein